jgi:proteasome beta subunit
MEMNRDSFKEKTDPNYIIKSSTTTIGIKFKDGVIIGTESQATAGFLVASKEAQKLFKINDYVAATISGGVADCQYLVNQAQALSNLEAVEKNKAPEVKWIANVLRNILFQGRSMFQSMMIIGGYSVEEKTGKLFGLDLLGTLFEDEKFLSYGSGSPFALGVLEADWKPNMSEQAAIKLAKSAIRSAILRDAGSGYDFQIVKITKNGFKPIEGFRG